MQNERSFYKCRLCGNIVGMIEDGGGVITCCGQEMELLNPNSTDAAQEKHVPVLARTGNRLTVSVGSAAHPMTEAHHIAWIAVAEGAKTQRIRLDKIGAPTAEFCVADGPLTVYAYCNLHGLWKKELND